MAKKFYRNSQGLFVENGDSLVRVGMIRHMRMDTHPGRVIKVVTVNEVVKQSFKNPLLDGRVLALSFREQDVNRSEYVWKPGEEFQVLLVAEPVGAPSGPEVIDVEKESLL